MQLQKKARTQFYQRPDLNEIKLNLCLIGDDLNHERSPVKRLNLAYFGQIFHYAVEQVGGSIAVLVFSAAQSHLKLNRIATF